MRLSLRDSCASCCSSSALLGKKPGKTLWLFVPLLFVLWTNLHGSFYVGLALVAAMAAGRGFDIFRRRPHFRMVLRDGKFRSLCALFLLAGTAVLLNPYGWRIFPDVWLTAANPNLTDLVEWRPLDVQMHQGQAAAVVGLALAIVYRLTPRGFQAPKFCCWPGWERPCCEAPA